MAIVEKGQGVNVGETEIPDNDPGSLIVSSSDGSAVITVDTSDGAEITRLSAAGVAGLEIHKGTGDAEVRFADEIGFIADPNCMIRRNTSDYLEFRMAGTDILGVSASGVFVENGNFGIGTITPSTKFECNGAATTIGAIATALTGTFTATQGSDIINAGSSTAFTTELHVGSAIKIPSSVAGDYETFTVDGITSDTILSLDSNYLGSTRATSGGAFTDSGELFAVKTGDSQTLFSVEPNRYLFAPSNLNVVLGSGTAGEDLTTGVSNLIVGYNVGTNVTTGEWNVFVGNSAVDGNAITDPDRSVVVGAQAGRDCRDDNVYVGTSAGQSVGADQNVAIGSSAMTVTGPSNSVAVGYHAHKLCTGTDNVVVGHSALDTAGDADNCVALGSGSLGAATGNGNIGIGKNAGNAIVAGSSNIHIGSDSDGIHGSSNQISIGADATTTAANQIMMGNHRGVDMTMDCPPLTVKQTSTSGAGISLEHEGSTGIIAHIGEDGDGGWINLAKAGTTEVKFICSGSSHVGSDTSRKFGVGNASPTSNFHSFGNNAYMTTAGNGLLTASHAVDVHSTILYATSGGSDIVASLPTAVGILGRQYTFKLVTDGGNDLVITTNGSETMDGSGTTYTIDTAKHAVTIQSDNVGWQVISKYVP